MLTGNRANAFVENYIIYSEFLEREVKVDCYMPPVMPANEQLSLLLINDGQDLIAMKFEVILQNLYERGEIAPLLCVGLHCSADRRNEYGTAKCLDYKGRGNKSAPYSRFVLEELMPFIRMTYQVFSFKEKSFAGFSLGGLSAMDIVWNNPREFAKVGVFSGSFWWRDKAQDDPDFDETMNRIMHRQIREGLFYPWLKFFFEAGALDEIADRNNNGIIDAIDDTLGLIEELKLKGYPDSAIKYLELSGGRHDVATWGSAFPEFLKWGWGN